VLAFVVAAVFASPEVGTGIRSAVMGSLIVAGILNWVEKRKEAKAQGGD
jgi:hypothetical protein